MKMGAQIQESKAKQEAQHEIEGLRIGADIAKHRAQTAVQAEQAKQRKPENKA